MFLYLYMQSLSAQQIYKLAELFVKKSDIFSFFDFVEDTNDARDHAADRAFERADSVNGAKLALKQAENILAHLYSDFPNLVRQLPEGSEWYQPVPGKLIAIFKKSKHQLFLATFLKEGQIIPGTVVGRLDIKIREMYAETNSKK